MGIMRFISAAKLSEIYPSWQNLTVKYWVQEYNFEEYIFMICGKNSFMEGYNSC